MKTIQEYVVAHTVRGECQCGLCFDKGTKPDPTGHTADMIFFKVAAKDAPSAERFKELASQTQGEFTRCDILDGIERGYLEIGAWIGDQGLALRFMALGYLLGVFDLLTPRTILGITLDDRKAMQMAQSGLVTVKTKGAPAK